MGIKLDETNELINTFNIVLDQLDDGEDVSVLRNAAETTFLADIAKSLAIIADHMEDK